MHLLREFSSQKLYGMWGNDAYCYFHISNSRTTFMTWQVVVLYMAQTQLTHKTKDIHAQAPASKLGKTINAMDMGTMFIGELTAAYAGFRAGIPPSSVSSNGLPLSSMV